MSDEEQNLIKGIFGLIILVIIFFVSIFSSNDNYWPYIGYKTSDITLSKKNTEYIYTLQNNGTECKNYNCSSTFQHQCMLISILLFRMYVIF